MGYAIQDRDDGPNLLAAELRAEQQRARTPQPAEPIVRCRVLIPIGVEGRAAQVGEVVRLGIFTARSMAALRRVEILS